MCKLSHDNSNQCIAVAVGALRNMLFAYAKAPMKAQPIKYLTPALDNAINRFPNTCKTGQVLEQYPV